MPRVMSIDLMGTFLTSDPWTHTSSVSSEIRPYAKSGSCRACNWRWNGHAYKRL